MRSSITAVVLVLSVGAVSAATTVTINGMTVQGSQSSIIVNNASVIVDGRVVSGEMVQGSGKVASETRDLHDFDELVLDIAAAVTVSAGDSPKCRITADDNILPLILTEAHGRALRITTGESYSSRHGVEIEIEVPGLTRAENNGSGSIEIAGIKEHDMELLINGSGDIHATGQAAELGASINGSGSLYATRLDARRVTIKLNGSGSADISVTGALSATINGSGAISYSGTPSSVDTVVQGSGRISKK